MPEVLGSLHLHIVLLLTVGFVSASILGYFAYRIGSSPLLGYLAAGYLIGPYSPGFVADMRISEQLAEIGIILMMFGVGLHLKEKDLFAVKKIAIPGALSQTLVTTLLIAAFFCWLGWSIEAGIVMGLCIGVASTVVLMRLLVDNDLVGKQQGHIAIGWLVLEDLLIVVTLLLLPVLASSLHAGEVSGEELALPIVSALAKFTILVLFMFTVGRKLLKFALSKVVDTNSSELFTLAVLAMTFGIAVGSALLFGTSIALGALIAGMVIGRTEVRHQVAAHALPMKDAFMVIFFLSVGMLFDPSILVKHFGVVLVIIAAILIVKPLVAFIIVRLFKYPNEVAITIAIALAQIGEFSFILAEQSMQLKIIPEQAYDIIVASAFVSIALNPLLFKLFKKRFAL